MVADKSYDVIVVGSGPGGYVTAVRSAQLGLRTAIIEVDKLGGVCLNWGCIPTKALLRSAEIYRNVKNSDEYGIEINGLKLNINKIVKRSREIASDLSKGVDYLLNKNKVDVIYGHGYLLGKGMLRVEKHPNKFIDLHAKHIILATGAKARSLPGMEPDGDLIWSYREAMVPVAMPKSILIVGSGAIGIEFASFYQTLDVDVTVIEVLPRILPVEDEEISALAQKAFEKEGIKIITSASLVALKKNAENITATIEKEGAYEELIFDRVIMAVGIVGNVAALGLENTLVKVEKNHVVVDEWSQTAEPNMYAIGDIAGPPWLAHKASHEGIICIEKIAGQMDVEPLNVDYIPGCTYSYPQIASIGLTEITARDRGYNLKIGRFPFIGNGKAIALGEPEGLVKVIFNDKTGELLGAHMIGVEVTELIQGFAIGMTLETTEAELMKTVFPHPTLSEMMNEAVLDAYDRVIHF
jgi:dihydrolipoamide dehydrogenase